MDREGTGVKKERRWARAREKKKSNLSVPDLFFSFFISLQTLMNVLWVLMAVTLEVAVLIRRAPSSACVTLSLASSWEVIRECVLVRTPVFYCKTCTS